MKVVLIYIIFTQQAWWNNLEKIGTLQLQSVEACKDAGGFLERVMKKNEYKFKWKCIVNEKDKSK